MIQWLMPYYGFSLMMLSANRSLGILVFVWSIAARDLNNHVVRAKKNNGGCCKPQPTTKPWPDVLDLLEVLVANAALVESQGGHPAQSMGQQDH
jgi:hypothetical protein